MEKDHDEASKRESEVRRKAREVNAKSRRLEEQLEAVNDRAKAFEQDLIEQRAQGKKLQLRLKQAETALVDAKAELEREQKFWESELQNRIEEERSRWQAELAQQTLDPGFVRIDSPTGSYRKLSASDVAGLHGRRNITRAASNDLPAIFPERLSSRRTSTQPFVRTPDSETAERMESTMMLSPTNGTLTHNTMTPPQAPSLNAIEPDDALDSISSPHRTVVDMLSVNTVGAGPSVQLVERMSAAVRRLESEKASSKDELTRLLAQRDEAREEVVALMREVEEKREVERKVENLEKELREMDRRYQTTLEMLGEKSERVDELKNDVQDLKLIYRELVESRTK